MPLYKGFPIPNFLSETVCERSPHYRVATIELAMSRSQAQKYRSIYRRHASILYGEGALPKDGPGEVATNSDEEPGCINMVAHRRLIHATQNPRLDVLVDSVGKKSLVADINCWYDKSDDYGATYFFRHPRPAS
jgi:hypothetical protein